MVCALKNAKCELARVCGIARNTILGLRSTGYRRGVYPRERYVHKLGIIGRFEDSDLYQRNRVLVNLLRELASDAVMINTREETRLQEAGGLVTTSRVSAGLRDLRAIWSSRKRLASCDTLFVPYPAYTSLILLRLVGTFRGRRVIADAFLELHSTVVEDRGLLPAGSWRAALLLAFQRLALRNADCVLIDTEEQAQLLRDRLRVNDERVVAIPVGIDEAQWFPLPLPATDTIRVIFWGTFIPLHGLEHIFAAASLLQEQQADIQIVILGDGQTADEVGQSFERAKLANLRWERGIHATHKIRAELAEVHIALGVFADTDKASRVIPYKVHQALASNRPVITRRSPAVSEFLCEEAGFVGCDPASPADLARTILELAARLRKGWRPSTRDLYEQHFGNDALRARLSAILNEQPVAP
ncbi:MAG: hypothetical protein Cons2KO_29810 [Congregibacter sp.]